MIAQVTPFRAELREEDFALARARGAADGAAMLRRIRLAAGLPTNGVPPVAVTCPQCGRTWGTETFPGAHLALHGLCPSCHSRPLPPAA